MQLCIKWWSLPLLLIVTHVTLATEDQKQDDLTQFDYPFLLGDWVLINSSPYDEKQNYQSIHLKLQSDYSFLVQIQRMDNTYEYWDGEYEVSGDTLVLGRTSIEPQLYSFANTHNRLILNGVTFLKMISQKVSGAWLSDSIGGHDIQSVGVDKMLLVLQPDFVFYFKASNEKGKEVLHRGVYYLEDDHLVLVYENGELNTTFNIRNNRMSLMTDDGEMTALLTKLQ
ncbi:hypothetical protein [Vibrio viridaestus]|uniref:WD40 repeat domain-containing protein n=1 Tax=Vibrio viridaestus TaxID=2487322 RepID=A0A3N9U661_9VIBR|nr:hypothetical protein [Vibrio viridaestus]RQW63556.1 hypothetical protein EES38_09935 [Vibrio viridaestus]